MRDDVYVGMLVSRDSLKHYGKGHDDSPPGRGSGRYPYGSGKRPHQHDNAISRKIEPYKWSLIDNIKDAVDETYDHIRSSFVNRVVNDFDERVSNQPIDRETGLHKKVKLWTSKQDAETVNPEFNDYDDFGDTRGITSNCEYCTLTYDMRRRGFDVRARSTFMGHLGDKLAKRCYYGAVTNNYMPNPQYDVDSKGNVKKEYWDYLEHELVSQGDGARGNFEYAWYGTYAYHSIVYEVENGKLVFRDCQSKESEIKPKDLFEMVNGERVICCTRLDNLKFKPKKVKEFCK